MNSKKQISDEYQEKKRKELIGFLKNFMNERIAFVTHREIAAWSLAVLYLTFLAGMYKILSKLEIEGHLIFLLIIYLIISLGIVMFFIHSQYGIHICTRVTREICSEFIFRLINKGVMIEELNWEFKSSPSIPEFLNEKIIEKSKEIHKFKYIAPWVPISWSCMRIFNKENYERSKLQLIESSIYLLLVFQTFCLILWIILK